jgi:hypothetical protein
MCLNQEQGGVETAQRKLAGRFIVEAPPNQHNYAEPTLLLHRQYLLIKFSASASMMCGLPRQALSMR